MEGLNLQQLENFNGGEFNSSTIAREAGDIYGAGVVLSVYSMIS